MNSTVVPGSLAVTVPATATNSTAVPASLAVIVPATATNCRSYSDTCRLFKALEADHLH